MSIQSKLDQVENLLQEIRLELPKSDGVGTVNPTQPTAPSTSPAQPAAGDINSAQQLVDRLVMQERKFGPLPNANRFLDAVNDVQIAIGRYNSGEMDPPDKAALKPKIEAGIVRLKGLIPEAPEGEARNSLDDYIRFAEKEMESPTDRPGAPNLTKGDMAEVERGDMTH